jgi:hypothetical protein
MREDRVALGCLLLVMGAGCTGGAERARVWSEDTLPTLIISAPDSVSGRVGLDSARWITAPPIRYPATVQPDPDHSVPVVMPGSGEVRLAFIRPRGAVHRGDTLAFAHGIAGTPSIPPILASSTEVWWPRHAAGESLWPGDTVGAIQHPGRFIAVGQVEVREATTLEPGDSAIVSFPGDDHAPVAGRIASITAARYRVEVAVHFHQSDDAPDAGVFTEVSLFPSGDRGKVLVVPATSIAPLPQGPALFLPRGPGTFEVRFIASDEHDNGTRVVHRGLVDRTVVAAGDLSALVAAAEDSFRARGRGRP